MRPRSKLGLGVVLCALLLGGCSTVDTRIAERPEAFRALGEGDRALVRAGKVREGFGKDAVYLAWGRPDETGRGGRGGKTFERWLYYAYDTRYVPEYIYVAHRGGRRYYDVPLYMPSTVTTRHLYKWAQFQGDRLSEWEVIGW